MRKPLDPKVEKGRIISGRLASTAEDGYNGAFTLRRWRRDFFVVASDGMGWEHVSVSVQNYPDLTPTWDEMCWIKDLFWGRDECVVQYHPVEEDYVNLHGGTLHLWRPTEFEFPIPKIEMV